MLYRKRRISLGKNMFADAKIPRGNEMTPPRDDAAPQRTHTASQRMDTPHRRVDTATTVNTSEAGSASPKQKVELPANEPRAQELDGYELLDRPLPSIGQER